MAYAVKASVSPLVKWDDNTCLWGCGKGPSRGLVASEGWTSRLTGKAVTSVLGALPPSSLQCRGVGLVHTSVPSPTVTCLRAGILSLLFGLIRASSLISPQARATLRLSHRRLRDGLLLGDGDTG